MQYKFVGRNMEVSQKLRNMTEKKLERLSKFFTDDTSLIATFKEEGRDYRVEVTIPVKGSMIRAEVSCEDPYTGLDEVMDKLERQITRYRSRLTDKAKNDKAFRAEYFTADGSQAEPISKIARVKEIDAPLMDYEEAALQLELTGHDFYLFKEAASGKVAVIYRRREENAAGATYGVLEVQ